MNQPVMMEYGISLGANLGDRLAALRSARNAIRMLPQSRLLACAPVYETEPVDAESSPLFLNTVILLESSLNPEALLPLLQKIEMEYGRKRDPAHRNAPRTLDMDIIYAGTMQCQTTSLQLPHPRWNVRRFAVQPLADLRPDLCLPAEPRTVREVLASLPTIPRVTLFLAAW